MINSRASFGLYLVIVGSFVLTGCFILIGCDSAANKAARQATVEDVSNNNSNKVDPEREKPGDAPRTISGIAKESAQKQPTTEKNADSDNAQQEPEKLSPIDAALKKLDEQEVVDTDELQEVPPAEVHAELLPMVEDHWVRMHPGYEVWVDKKNQQVIVGGRISMREGLLEMFACPMGTKEHESVIATISNAEIVHIGLLGVGAIKGITAYWTEESGVVTAQGPVCEITIAWMDGDQPKKVNAKQFVIDQTTGKALQHDWVFSGSRVWIDPDNPEHREYQADWGDMICVSNFPTAMMDLNVESSTTNSGLLFSANPDVVPVPGKPVLVFIKPDLSTNPSEEEMSRANRHRTEQEAKMAAELEKRIQEMEARDAEREKNREANRKDLESNNTEKSKSDG